MTPYPWTVADERSPISGHGYAITHCREKIAWFALRADAEAASRVHQLIKLAGRLIDTIERLPADQRALIEPYYVDAIKTILSDMQSGGSNNEEK